MRCGTTLAVALAAGCLLFPSAMASTPAEPWHVLDLTHDVEVWGSFVLAPVPSVDIASAGFELRDGGLAGSTLTVDDLERTGPEDGLFAQREYTVREWLTAAVVDPENYTMVFNLAVRIDPPWQGVAWFHLTLLSDEVNGLPELQPVPGQFSVDAARGELRWAYDAPVAAAPIQVDAVAGLVGCDDVGGALSCGPLQRLPVVGEAPQAGGIVAADRAGNGARREATLPEGLWWSDLFPPEGGVPEDLLTALDEFA